MNSPSLHALLIDQQLGELSPEVAELLETHLAQNAEARAEADRLKQTLAVTQQAVLLHPDLARVEASVAESARPSPRRSFGPAWLAKAAAIAALATVVGVGGFFAGRRQDPVSATVVASASPQVPRKDSPWARYRFAPEAGGAGWQVVRVETAVPEHPSVQ